MQHCFPDKEENPDSEAIDDSQNSTLGQRRILETFAFMEKLERFPKRGRN
jgi:hypothetical protein